MACSHSCSFVGAEHPRVMDIWVTEFFPCRNYKTPLWNSWYKLLSSYLMKSGINIFDSFKAVISFNKLRSYICIFWRYNGICNWWLASLCVCISDIAGIGLAFHFILDRAMYYHHLRYLDRGHLVQVQIAHPEGSESLKVNVKPLCLIKHCAMMTP
jgi:hypothetical protein